jgi:hypothetical protein
MQVARWFGTTRTLKKVTDLFMRYLVTLYQLHALRQSVS